MKTLCKSLLLVVFSIQIAFANTHNNGVPKGKYTKEKTVKKEFTVTPYALLKVDNSYGNLNITSWNENKTIIEVVIKTSGNNEKKVIEKLNEIHVNFDANSDMVSASTIFSDSKWGWGWNSKNVNIEVNYTIKVPINNEVDLNNDYGAIIIDKLNGTAKISCDYGKLDIGELWGDNNYLKFDYTTNSRIGIIKNGKIQADYSGFVVEKTKHLEIIADYTNSKVEKADYVYYQCDYGSVYFGDIMNLKGNGDYLTAKIDSVFGNIDLDLEFGSVRINNITPKAGNITIEGDYTGIRLGYDPQYYFNFDIDLEYAGLSGKDNLTFTLKDSDYTSHHYKGYYTHNNSGKYIRIKSEYGGVTLNRK
ncbi:hypothetical protein NBRC110019_06880 [Neptunitalea chrysea]|uniref:Adhesin domain-containing protein n=1 Tax=Neptunitalea chrysea TaxID=1647581 RepID=A0A9W6ETU2_9FLAO|nr:hypothetical protein [Neptunitalea chrysea]GLB51649.1 hypothetical protein NBRC110019_06880 [Neptunitalea chrysea]